MVNDQNLLVGSDGALYCKVEQPQPLVLYDLDSVNRVSNNQSVGVMQSWPYYQRPVSMAMPVGFPAPIVPGASLNMVGMPFSPMGGLQTLQPVGPFIMPPVVPQPPSPPEALAVVPDTACSSEPSLALITSNDPHAPVPATAQGAGGDREVFDARRHALLTTVDELSNTLSELRNDFERRHHAESMRLMSFSGVNQAPVQVGVSMSAMTAPYNLRNLHQMQVMENGQGMKTAQQSGPPKKESALIASLRKVSSRSRDASDDLMEPTAKRARQMIIEQERIPGQGGIWPTSGTLSTVEVYPGAQTLQPIPPGLMGASHARMVSVVDGFEPVFPKFPGQASHSRMVSVVANFRPDIQEGNGHQAAHTRRVSVVENFQHVSQEVNGQPVNTSLVSSAGRAFLLYVKCDDLNLSPFLCLARKQVEVFEATEVDAKRMAQGRNKSIAPGQVGLRCIHCIDVPRSKRKAGCVYYPTTLGGIYQVAHKMIKSHLLHTCMNIPKEIRDELIVLKENSKATEGKGKRYWSDCIESFGVYENGKDGLALRPETVGPV